LRQRLSEVDRDIMLPMYWRYVRQDATASVDYHQAGNTWAYGAATTSFTTAEVSHLRAQVQFYTEIADGEVANVWDFFDTKIRLNTNAGTYAYSDDPFGQSLYFDGDVLAHLFIVSYQFTFENIPIGTQVFELGAKIVAGRWMTFYKIRWNIDIARA